MGVGMEEIPYTLVEIDDDITIVGSSCVGRSEEVVVTQADVIADRDPIPPYEE
jgi:hypothetical protein